MAGSINGTTTTDAPGPQLAETLGDPNVIRVLEDGLAAAKAGRIVGCALVVAFEDGKPGVSLGGRSPLTLYYACDRVKAMLSASIEGPPSKILRPGG